MNESHRKGPRAFKPLSDPTPSFNGLTRSWLCREAGVHVFVISQKR